MTYSTQDSKNEVLKPTGFVCEPEMLPGTSSCRRGELLFTCDNGKLKVGLMSGFKRAR